MTIHDVMVRWFGPLVMATSSCLAQQQPNDATNAPNAELGKAYIRGVEVRLPSEGRTDEVRLVGLEADGNGFRDRTPVLGRADRTAGKVDREALRARRLAMYAAPAAAEAPADSAPVEETAGPPLEPMPASAPSRRRPVFLVLIGMLGTAGGLLVMWLRHNRTKRR